MATGRKLQHINLYQAEFRPSQVVFPASHMLAGLGLLLLGLLALYGWGVWQNRALEAQVLQAEKLTRSLEGRLAAIGQAHAQASVDPALLETIAGLETRLAGLARAEQAIRSGAVGALQGWSTQFQALTRMRVPGLWLTGVRLEGSPASMTLNGRALDGAAPARYISLLRREPPFVGLEFAALSIAEPESRPGPAETEATKRKPRFLEFSLSAPARSGPGAQTAKPAGSPP